MGGRAEWRATLRPRIWTLFVLPLVVGGLVQLALVSSSQLGAMARSNPLWFAMVPVYASIAVAIANTLIARRTTYTIDGETLIVRRWWTRRSYSLVGVRTACGKCTSMLHGVVGTLLRVTTSDGTIAVVGTGHVFPDAASYTLPAGPAHAPALGRDDFVALLARLGAPPSARATEGTTTTIEVTPSGATRVMWWSFGSMLVAMVAALGGAFAERFARTHGWSPDSTEACALAGAFAALVVAALLLFRFRGRSLRLEFTAGVVSLYRGTRVVHADVPVEQLAIVHGSHLVGRGGGTIATLLVSFPAGRTLRIGGSGVAPSEQLRRRSTWLVHPRLAVSALEWPILIERLQRAEVRP